MKLKSSPDKKNLQWEARIAGLVLIGLLLFIFETNIPRPLPWMKLGLSNIAVVLALFWLGWEAAATVFILRLILGSIFVGTLFSPGFFLAAGGGLLAVLVMGLAYQTGWFGILTISVLGAIFHNLGQLLVANFLLFGNHLVWYLWPYLFIAGILTGTIIGWISYHLLKRLLQDFPAEKTFVV